MARSLPEEHEGGIAIKYQLICPKCNHEFQYDNGYYDRNIVKLASEITDIMKQLTEFKLLPKEEQFKRSDWRKRAKHTLMCKQQEISELKAIRKVCDQQLEHMRHNAFKSIVRERFGEAVFDELISLTDEEIKAYQLSGLMRHEYSRSGGKGVTSINKV